MVLMYVIDAGIVTSLNSRVYWPRYIEKTLVKATIGYLSNAVS